MHDRLRFLMNRIRERLWVRPLLVCIVSIIGAFLAHLADGTGLREIVPDITNESIETLLKIVSASMLVIATFAVASMVAAYASASSSATPRSFSLVIADDTSQNALSTFIGAFIFSIVALVALMNGYYDKAGRFTLFVLTLLVFAAVIITFVRWVDRIARLGRLGATVDKVEEAAARAIRRRQASPLLGGVAAHAPPSSGRPVAAASIGYVQHVDIAGLQARAEKSGLRIIVASLPGTFCAPNRPVAYAVADAGHGVDDDDAKAIAGAFVVGDARAFDDDPRFGFVVLSEIASRALSPAVNDPGTAIDVIGTLVRLFALWEECGAAAGDHEVRADRIVVPTVAMCDLFDDAFTGIARDGAGAVEVAVRLQKGLESIAALGVPELREHALAHARLALERSEKAMQIAHDLAAVRAAARFALEPGR